MVTDDGVMRFFMRGRSLNFYAPTNMDEYQMANVGEPPSEKLKLEWVYPLWSHSCRYIIKPVDNGLDLCEYLSAIYI